MAERSLVRTPIPNVGAKLYWEQMTDSDTATPAELNSTEGVVGCVQVTGTFGGATLSLQGSNDGTNYVTLKDPQGSAIALTAAGITEFSTAARYIKPSTASGSSSDLDVTVILRG